jgi:hypothetical protein
MVSMLQQFLSSCRNFNDWTNRIWRCSWIRSFCDAMISIRKEIEAASTDEPNNVLKTSYFNNCWYLDITLFKKSGLSIRLCDNKFWPSVRRVDETYGDRNLICSCAPIEAYVTFSTNNYKMPRNYRGIFFSIILSTKH